MRTFIKVRATEIPLHGRIVALVLVLALLLPVCGFCDIQTTSQTLMASVSPDGKISVPGTVPLLQPDTSFSSATGSVTVSYWARTSSSGGGGSVTVQAVEFTPTGGPVAASVSYLCTGATLGSACSGGQTLSTSTQTPLVSLPGASCTGGGGSCTSQSPNTVQMTFTLPSQPHYKTGSYASLLTFTISTM